jgi:predicted dehydrogenase
MFGATAKPGRDIHIIGTTGELQGDLEDLTLVLRHPDPRSGRPSGREYSQQDVPIAMPESEDGGPVGHGGGDVRLIEDFISVLKGEATSKGVSRLEDSLTGHRIAFAAETARLEKRVVEL